MSFKLKLHILTIGLVLPLVLTGCAGKTAEPELPASSPIQTQQPDSVCPFRISELMAKNRAAYQAADGGFYDWIELENSSGEAASLSGWTLCKNDTVTGYVLPDITLEPGELLLINARKASEPAPSTGFSLSCGDTVFLSCGDSVRHSAVNCTSDEPDVSVALDANGNYAETNWCTPGLPNTDSGWDSFCSSRTDGSALVINEVMTRNTMYLRQYKSFYDWVELKNVSSTPIKLSDYWLSDDADDYHLWQLPSGTLDPGKTIVFFCSSETGATKSSTGFSLNSSHEQLFLSTSDSIADYVSLHDVPVDMSYGRVDGSTGFFYLSEPTPNKDNTSGWRSFSAAPVSLSPDGVFNDKSSVKVELEGSGKIYYTTDGSKPDEDSSLYGGAFTLGKTAVVRAVNIDDGKAPSAELVLSYIINEDCTLPVVSVVASDYKRFMGLYNESNKTSTSVANVAYYEDGKSFNMPCDLNLKGNASLLWPKKNLGVKFRSCYGVDSVDCDIFGGGVTHFTSLNIRTGQDYPISIIRNELMEKLAMNVSDTLLVERSKYCRLYINGNYWGLYNLREDFSKQFYASRFDVDKAGVSNLKCPVRTGSDVYQQLVQFCVDHDMTDPDNYAEFCSHVDIESVVDWFIVEGYSGNSDVGVNMRFMGSAEGDGKWHIGVFDFDWTLYDTQYTFYNLVKPIRVVQFSFALPNLLKNEDFRARILTRYSEVIRNELSNETVLALIDEYQQQIDPEVSRDRERWYLGYKGWLRDLEALKDFIIKNDYDEFTIDRLCSILHVTAEERVKYFGE